MESHSRITQTTDKGLVISGVPALRLAKKYGTPLYVYSEDAITQKMREYLSAFRDYPDSVVAYAGKAYLTMRMANLTARERLWLDTASGGELYIALQAGFPAEKIIFHGNNKSLAELEMAVTVGVGRIVVDNVDELRALQRVARKEGRVQGIQIRLTPGVDAHTHRYLTTGEMSSKFGIAIAGGAAMDAVKEAEFSSNLNFMGLHCHIGSQIFDREPYAAAVETMMKFASDLKERTGIAVRELNLGGGLGVDYLGGETASPTVHVSALIDETRKQAELLKLPLPRLFVEPGRSIVAEAGVTLYTVGSVKRIPNGETVVAVDGGMADNPRPALYGAQYTAVPAFAAGTDEPQPVRIVGKHCEEGDVLVAKAMLPPLQPGQVIALLVSGAYQYSMRSNYNALLQPAVVHVAGGKPFLVVRRQEYRDLIAKEVPLPRPAAEESMWAAKA